MKLFGARTLRLVAQHWRYIPLVVCASVAGLSVQLLIARQHMTQGVGDLRTVVRVVRSPTKLRDAAVRGQVRRNLVSAQQEFSKARLDLVLTGPVLDHLQWLPIVGGRLAAASPAADAAYEATSASIHLVDGLSPIWPVLSNHAATVSLPARLANTLQQRHDEFVSAQTETGDAEQALKRLPAHTGDAALDRTVARLHRELPLLSETNTWLALAPTLLGVGRPAHILLAWENPAELRATGGFLGESDLMTIDNGRISGRFTGRAPTHEITTALVPLPEAVYTNENYWILCDSNWSPDFPLSARLERWFYGEDMGVWADSVIDFVDTATPDILHAVGRVYLPSYKLWVDAGNVQALAERYVHGKYWGPAHTGADPDTLRKQFIHDTLQAVLERVQHLPMERWPAVGAAVARAISRGDILLYDRRPSIEAAIRAVGANGGILHSPGDFLYVVDDNRSYSKLNPYVRESATYEIHILPSGWLSARLTLHYHVNPSPSTMEGYGPAYGAWGTKHDYQDFLRVYVPPGAVLVRMTGVQRWAPVPAYGLTQFAGRFLVRQRQSTAVVVEYRLPPNVLATLGFATYALTIQHQSGADLTALRLRIQGSPGITMEGGQQVISRVLSLVNRQTRLTFALDRKIFQPARTVTVQQSGTDPYVPFASLHDPLHSF